MGEKQETELTDAPIQSESMPSSSLKSNSLFDQKKTSEVTKQEDKTEYDSKYDRGS